MTTMSDVLTDLSDDALVRAIEENQRFALCHFAYPPVGEIHEEADRTWYRTGRDSFLLNAVLGARLPEEDPDRAITDALEPFQGLPMLWVTGPATSPPDLGRRLAPHGFMEEAEDLGMATDLASFPEAGPLPRGVEIDQIDDDPVALREAADVMAVAFETPGLVFDTFLESLSSLAPERRGLVRNYLATLHGEPVGASTLILGAGVAGVYNVATVPDVRGRGIGTATTLRCLADARELGYRAAILQSRTEAAGIYRRLGFRELCRIALHVRH